MQKILFLKDPVLMGTLHSRVALTSTRVELKFALTILGTQSVIMVGDLLMPEWSVNSLDIPTQAVSVRCIYIYVDRRSIYIYIYTRSKTYHEWSNFLIYM